MRIVSLITIFNDTQMRILRLSDCLFEEGTLLRIGFIICELTKVVLLGTPIHFSSMIPIKF